MSSDVVAGKIVFCEALLDDGSAILETKGVGVIYSDPLIVNPDVAFSWPLPATIISPGVDILAGWSPMSPSSVYEGDTRSTLYNIISGTSMSCPHASGAAAYVKAAHPNWSPSAIKSALMTTAYVMDPSKHEDGEFSYGSGHINPVGATDPGLVFDASEADYIDLLCKQGYNTSTLELVTGDNITCDGITPGRAWDMNYPSFSLYVEDGDVVNATFTRTVTNVGPPNSTYTATVETPSLFVGVSVEPSTLTFSSVGQPQRFTVNVTGLAISQQPIMSGAITWTDGTHVVRTPLVVYNYFPGAPYNLFSDQSSITGSNTFQRSSTYKKIGSVRHHKARP